MQVRLIVNAGVSTTAMIEENLKVENLLLLNETLIFYQFAPVITYGTKSIKNLSIFIEPHFS